MEPGECQGPPPTPSDTSASYPCCLCSASAPVCRAGKTVRKGKLSFDLHVWGCPSVRWPGHHLISIRECCGYRDREGRLDVEFRILLNPEKFSHWLQYTFSAFCVTFTLSVEFFQTPLPSRRLSWSLLLIILKFLRTNFLGTVVPPGFSNYSTHAHSIFSSVGS